MANQVAQTINNQIGHRAFVMMGVKQKIAISDEGLGGLIFRIKGCKKINHVKIVLDESDTYTVTFLKVLNLGLNIKEVEVASMVYADSLHEVIEANTGLYLSL